MRFQPAAYGLALLIAGVVLPFQIPRILERGSWVGGSASVMGNVDKMSISTKTTVVDYSYEVGGKRYTGEDVGRDFGVSEGPERVTYAKSNPAISTLRPDRIESIYNTSVVMAIVGVLPLVIMLFLELIAATKAGRQAPKDNKP